MEYQLVDEITDFWNELMIPIVMGIITLIFCLWVIGKNNRKYWIDKILEKESNKYILSNGIYIPKKDTDVNLIKAKIKNSIGLLDVKPILIVFLILLSLYGVYKVVLSIFLPSMTTLIPNKLFASGVDDYLLADIWRMIPKAQDLNQVYFYIEKNSEYTQNMLLFISIEAYLKLFLFIVFVVFIFEVGRKRTVNILRLFLSIFVVCILLILTYFAQIQAYNHETRYKCYEVHNKLVNENYMDNVENIDIYLQKVKKEKKYFENDVYFGAYSLQNTTIDNIENISKEIYRFYTKKEDEND